MNLRHATTPLALAGAAAIALSFVWQSFDDGQSAWSPEQAGRYSETAGRLKELSFSRATPERDAELKRLEAEYDALRDDLEHAKQRGGRVAWILRVAGVVMLLPAVFRAAGGGGGPD